MPSLDRRDQFLIEMYNQLVNEISRHILVTWQSIATLVASLAAFTLVKEQIISYSIAVSIILIVCFWFMAHVYDASFWYNRNLAIIANIERQFLSQNDLVEIHYYFGKHRPKNRMISHLVFQKILALAFVAVAIVIYVIKVIIPLKIGEQDFDHEKIIPCLIFIGGILIWIWCHLDGRTKYQNFLDRSPGKKIDAEHIHYDNGHGF